MSDFGRSGTFSFRKKKYQFQSNFDGWYLKKFKQLKGEDMSEVT